MNREELQVIGEREREKQQSYRCRILCCASTPCLSSGATAVIETFKEVIKEFDLEAEVTVTSTGCMGPCSRGPLVTVQMNGQQDVIYEHVTPELARDIALAHAAPEAKPLDRNVLPADLPFFNKQKKVVLANSGLIDPTRLESYVARDGYSALAHALREMTPTEVCEEVIRSGLRGRGGAGYPAGLKWDLVRKAPGDKKYIIANGDEGDPGAYMDRTLMESDPHRILEGMAIAGYAVGADQGFVYVRGEYPIAAKRLENAIRMAERRGLLGSRVLDSPFGFRIDIRIGAGAFVCGEETALMASIMGRRGQPWPRPPYPAQKGLWGLPTLINNVETFGNIAPIISHGADWFGAIGTEKSKGTKIFALAGTVETTGLIEVPMGISLRDIVFEIGGGIPNDRQFKAAQTGGPSGGCIPTDHLDTPVDYESLGALGSIMGSGGLVVMDDTSCMPDVAKFFMEFCMEESCGKCVPCRVGTVQLHRILEHVTDGSATLDDLDRLEELCVMMKETSLCGLGQSAPNPLLSTLKYFREEYEAHITNHTCPAGKCTMFGVPPLQLTRDLLRNTLQAKNDTEVS
ncbi:NuoF family protein [Desulfofustis glycolicus]|uniref:NAD(P)-dependent nickel-iron dehydrogenase flavin-containing subunit n=1 Tax=Desulfofustis glycolicus DSM 9705 TaxID=1121409 RepID=A0A1M5XRK5_9BACT|nr:NuoF family protein [Desulfofustis glycolicus]MCB2217834.1 NAD(P)H-dependent oxidoreductase subunit E [Desulfobulbaceae bacterium]SHI02451.1 NAD(P)-dependent nickel-iron dehydrogenase flavin-containing subunit [Desulfofustis glycolicus DSM 9705]